MLVYERGPLRWISRGALSAPTLETGARFGAALDSDGDRIAVGAPGALDGAGQASGAVYVFDWSQRF